MENILNFHGEEDFHAGFFSMRIALSDARSVVLTLGAPVTFIEPCLALPPSVPLIEPSESHIVLIRTSNPSGPPSTYEEAMGMTSPELSCAAVPRPIVQPTPPPVWDWSRAIPAGYESDNSDDSYLAHWL